jgi:hypothetical protein
MPEAFETLQAQVLGRLMSKLRKPHVEMSPITEVGSSFKKMEPFGLNLSKDTLKIGIQYWQTSVYLSCIEFVKLVKFYFSFILMRYLPFCFSWHDVCFQLF